MRPHLIHKSVIDQLGGSDYINAIVRLNLDAMSYIIILHDKTAGSKYQNPYSSVHIIKEDVTDKTQLGLKKLFPEIRTFETVDMKVGETLGKFAMDRICECAAYILDAHSEYKKKKDAEPKIIRAY